MLSGVKSMYMYVCIVVIIFEAKVCTAHRIVGIGTGLVMSKQGSLRQFGDVEHENDADYWPALILLGPRLTSQPQSNTKLCHYYRTSLYVSTVFAVIRCLSVCHIGGLYPHGRRYRQTSYSAQ